MNPFLYKWLKLSLVSLVACGFVAMAIYAYLKREDIRAAQPEPPLVAAPTQALKTRPESPGGLEFPNQDKLVFDLLEGTAPASQVTATVTALSATTSGAAAASSFADSLPNHGEAEAVPPTVSAPASSAVAAAVPSTPTVVAAPPVVSHAKQAPAPQPAAVAEAKPAIKEQTKTGAWSVQLAAVGSTADAHTTAKRLQAKFAPLKPLNIRVVPAPGGKRYRVQFSGLASRAAAQAVCDKLGSQPCFPVGK